VTVAVRRTALTLEDAVQQGLNAALDGYGVAETAVKLWEAGLDDEAADACAVVGLRAMIHDRLRALRQPVEEDDGVAERLSASGSATGRPVVNINYAKEHWQRVLAANYEAADGSRKALRAFTSEDVLHLRTLAGARADGYLRLRDAMDAAAALLKRHKKSTVSDLPEKAQRAIAEALS
jgi:hypothetical protein